MVEKQVVFLVAAQTEAAVVVKVKEAEVMVVAVRVAVQVVAWKELVAIAEGRLDSVERCHRIDRRVCRKTREMRRKWVLP